MPDITSLAPTQKNNLMSQNLLEGYISQAPIAPGDALNVIIPAYSLDYSFTVEVWSPKGLSIPSQGDKAYLALVGPKRIPVLLDWQGSYSTAVAELAALDTRLDTLEGQTLDSRLDVLEGQTLDARLDAIEAGPEALRHIGDIGEPPFLSGWVNYDSGRPAGFYRHNGRVYLSGVIKGGVVNSAAFVLPAGYTPVEGGNTGAEAVIFSVASNSAMGFIQVYTDGIINPAVGSNVYFNLEGISFRHA